MMGRIAQYSGARFAAVLMTACVFISVNAPMVSAKDRLDVDMGRFPKGTECTIHGTTGKVSFREKRNELAYQIRGDTRSVTVKCVLPDGRRYMVDTAPLVRPDVSFTSMQLNADNKGVVIWNKGGIKMIEIKGFLRKF